MEKHVCLLMYRISLPPSRPPSLPPSLPLGGRRSSSFLPTNPPSLPPSLPRWKKILPSCVLVLLSCCAPLGAETGTASCPHRGREGGREDRRWGYHHEQEQQPSTWD